MTIRMPVIQDKYSLSRLSSFLDQLEDGNGFERLEKTISQIEAVMPKRSSHIPTVSSLMVGYRMLIELLTGEKEPELIGGKIALQGPVLDFGARHGYLSQHPSPQIVRELFSGLKSLYHHIIGEAFPVNLESVFQVATE